MNNGPCGPTTTGDEIMGYFPDEDGIARHGDTLFVELNYPRLKGKATHVEIGLCDVRAADSIRVCYDFERDGWCIEQASKFSWLADDPVCDPDWQEVAFVQAWGREDSADEVEPSA